MADRPYMRRWEVARLLGVTIQTVKKYDGRGLTPIKCEDGWRVQYARKDVELFVAAHRPKQRADRKRKRRVHAAAARVLREVKVLVDQGKKLQDCVGVVNADPDLLLECYRMATLPEEELMEERERERHEDRMEFMERRHVRRMHRLARLTTLSVSGLPKPPEGKA